MKCQTVCADEWLCEPDHPALMDLIYPTNYHGPTVSSQRFKLRQVEDVSASLEHVARQLSSINLRGKSIQVLVHESMALLELSLRGEHHQTVVSPEQVEVIVTPCFLNAVPSTRRK